MSDCSGWCVADVGGAAVVADVGVLGDEGGDDVLGESVSLMKSLADTGGECGDCMEAACSRSLSSTACRCEEGTSGS